jgi:hypothetical protein
LLLAEKRTKTRQKKIGKNQIKKNTYLPYLNSGYLTDRRRFFFMLSPFGALRHSPLAPSPEAEASKGRRGKKK